MGYKAKNIDVDKFIEGLEYYRRQQFIQQAISIVSKGEKNYRYKKTGEVYNGQIYINGECCTDGHGNEVVYG